MGWGFRGCIPGIPPHTNVGFFVITISCTFFAIGCDHLDRPCGAKWPRSFFRKHRLMDDCLAESVWMIHKPTKFLWCFCSIFLYRLSDTPAKLNIAPEKLPSQKGKDRLPSIELNTLGEHFLSKAKGNFFKDNYITNPNNALSFTGNPSKSP